MRYLRVVSDLHLDFDIGRFSRTRIYHPDDPVRHPSDMLWLPPPLDGDLETGLILAGDIWHGRKLLTYALAEGGSWLAKVARQFQHVVVVLGNHDYWGKNLGLEPEATRELIIEQGLTNVTLLEKNVVVVDQVKFVGGTLWTDYNRHNPLVMGMAPSYMNDYRYITATLNYRKLRPLDAYDVHVQTRKFIFDHVTRDHEGQKVVVVTHMAPSSRSVSIMYSAAHHVEPNFLYYSELEPLILTKGKDIDLWFHGHMHHSVAYQVGETMVMSNPRGYGTENEDFNPNFRITL